jgi:hypothetical protein
MRIRRHRLPAKPCAGSRRAGAATLSIAAIVGLIVALPHGGAGESVVSPTISPTTSPTASPTQNGVAAIDPDAAEHDAAILQKAMPDFAISSADAQGGLRPDRVDSVGLPDGWTATVALRVSVGEDPSLGQCYFGGGSTNHWQQCVPRTLADGKVVSVTTLQNKSSVPQDQVALVRYARPDGVFTWARMEAVPPQGSGTAADNDPAFRWAQAYADRLAAVATDPGLEPDRRFGYDPDAVAHNDALFAADLGPDFDLAGKEKGGVKPGTASAAGLPSNFTTMVFRGLGPTDEHVCDPMQYATACVDHTTATGKTVQERWGHYRELGSGGTAERSVTVYYDRPDGLQVQVELRTMEPTADATTAREAAAHGWLEGLVDRLVTAATDPGIEPEPQPTPPPMPPANCAAARAEVASAAKGTATPPACPVTNP